MGPEREEVYVQARVDGFSRHGDKARGLSEVDTCKINHNMYMLICMGQTSNARSTWGGKKKKKKYIPGKHIRYY